MNIIKGNTNPIVLAIVFLSIIGLFFILSNDSTANIQQVLPIQEAELKIQEVFGEDIKDLKVLNEEKLNGKTHLIIQGKGTLYRIDNEKKVVLYSTENINLINSGVLSLDSAKIKALNQLEKINAKINIQEYKLVTNEIIDDNRFKTYYYEWEKRNSNNVIIDAITLRTNQLGEIITFTNIDKNIPAANSTINLTEDDAKRIAIKNIEDKISPFGFNIEEIEVTGIDKHIIRDTITWKVTIKYPGGSDSKNPLDVHDFIFVNAINGEIIEPF